MELTILIVYGTFLIFIFCYSLVQLNLAWTYSKWLKNNVDQHVPFLKDDDLPEVTVQLPVFNELYVVERIIDAIVALNYPKDKLIIQVLDDSTDESFDLAEKKILSLAALGFSIRHISRPSREGYKAGALAYGLERTQSEFIAIFDADFVPDPDFLRQTIPFLVNQPNLGVVQTRWKHLNEDYSPLTRLQAFGLDAHFTVEQMGRNQKGHFINFNGTAGIWRKACIDDAGGWQSDTITEDLDLSYRAQLKGWKFMYLPDVGSPAELPAEMNALKSQQFRWTKGAAECAVKNLPNVLRSKEVCFWTKLHAVFHLMNSFIFVCVLSTALLSIPLLFIKGLSTDYSMWFNLASIFLLSFIILAYFYWVSRPKQRRKLKFFIKDFPFFLSVSMGLSLHNSIAVIEGYLGRKTPFMRTPKFALNKSSGTWSDKKYRPIRVSPLTLFEGVLSLYFLSGIGVAFYFGEYGLLPFHIMLTLGFGYVFYYSLKHSRL